MRELNLVCWGLFAGLLFVPLCFLIWLRLSHGAACDFVYFYGIGQILNSHAPASLYNLGLQLSTFAHVTAHPHGEFYGPSPYPPFVAQFFSAFARLPFTAAFLLWLVASAALFLGGIALLARENLPADRLQRSLFFCLALAFRPLLLDTLANGQIASIAFFFICLAVFFERRNQPLASGLALSVLAYKPTLLFLMVPMLLVTRRFKAFLGFVSGVAILLLEATLAEGAGIWPVYLHFLKVFRQVTGTSAKNGLSHWQFVDLNSLSRALPGGRSPVALGLLAIIAVAVVLWLATLLWESATAGVAAQRLAWASVITWTLLLNLYVPIYDSALAVIAVALTLGTLKDSEWGEARDWTLFAGMLIFVTAWITEPVARRFGVQPLTIMLFLFGLLQLLLLRQAVRTGALRREPTLQPCQDVTAR